MNDDMRPDLSPLSGHRASLLALLVVVLVVGALLAFRMFKPASAIPPGIDVDRADIRETVAALGILVPSRYVDVGAQVSGQLVRLHVGPGDTVKAGQPIAQIDPTRYAAQVAQDKALIADLRAQLNGWQSRLEFARWTLERNNRLAPEGAATEQATEQSRTEFAIAKTTVASLEAQIEKARNALKVNEANLGYTEIRAPIAGLVISPTSAAYGNTWSKLDIAHEGQTLNASQNAPVLLRIADLDRMRVRAQVSEADVARLAPGMAVEFTTLGRPERRIAARLDAVEPTPELVNGAIFYNAVFEVPNPERSLLPQMTAQVSFIVAEAKNTLTVPLAALASTRRQNGQVAPGCTSQGEANADCVTVLIDGQAVARQIKLGMRDETRVQILDGLAEGDRVTLAAAGPPPAGGRRGGGNGKQAAP